LIVDIRMPQMSGLELQARLKQEGCNVPIIFITAYDNAEIRAQAMKEGAVEFLAKPFDHQLCSKCCDAPSIAETYGVAHRASGFRPEALAVLQEVLETVSHT
jgi:two-component system, LuxR family, response regulator FixJ